MTEKMKRFAQEYLVDFNATQAAKRAGYSKRTAAEMGSENLRKPQIIKEIEKGKARIIEDKDTIILENIVFWRKMREKAKNDHDKLRASENLGRYVAMFTDKIDITGDINLVTDGDDKNL